MCCSFLVFVISVREVGVPATAVLTWPRENMVRGKNAVRTDANMA
jgi:hypothetical protein